MAKEDAQMPNGMELPVLKMGYAFEMLRFLVHYQWFLGDTERAFPKWLETYAGQINHGLCVPGARGKL